MNNQFLKRAGLLLIFWADPAAVCWADGYDDGFEALQQNHQEKALKIWKPLAERGDADAQFGLGVLYYSGEKLPKKPDLAVKWFGKAARQGHSGAQFNLGNEYKRGAGGLAQDDAKAAFWWKKAAQKGLLQAQYNLGMAYYFGSGVKQDRDKAMFWFKMSADNRYEPAMSLIKRLRAEAAKQAGKKNTPKPEPVKLKPVKPKPVPAAGQPSSSGRVLREAWIRAQPADHYTIQLFSSADEKNVQEYISKHKLKGAAYFRTQRDGKSWYSVLLGSFSDVKQARATVTAYHGSLFKESPWVRQFKGIHDLIGR